MHSTLEQLRDHALQRIEAAQDLDALDAVRAATFGRKGALKAAMKGLAGLSAEERPAIGRLANDVKTAIQQALDARRQALEGSGTPSVAPGIDISVPGLRPTLGREHPIRRAERDLIDIFARLGFEVAEGPEVELERYNFDALNIPAEHPARDGFDTFYVRDDVVLRSHTSPVQIRLMEGRQPPIRAIMPGRVYRPDTADATHYPVFHQLEGLVVGERITFADLKGCLTIAMKELFGTETETRFRPSFFPFTEPSAEVDVSYEVDGERRWLELLGAGMVHPNVFQAVGYDSERYTGFAFGMGIDRIAMIRHRITDIRLLFENDLRFLQQF
ncbi:MAG: phenylalanine--tRNA ligase subunit alpha [Candidatus Brocadiae bacterium]|nr:phenylalanine--tRNA ligase subunit alpha [Candidatus Brocadiia bacterium]